MKLTGSIERNIGSRARPRHHRGFLLFFLRAFASSAAKYDKVPAMRACLLAVCLTIALLASFSAKTAAGQTVAPSPAQSASPSPSPSPTPADGQTNGQTPQQFAAKVVGKTKDGEPIYSGGPGIKPPKITSQPEPDYSRQARKKNIRGVIGIEGYVGTDGKYHDAKIVRSLDPIIDPDAIAGVSRWKFKPATKDGKPVNCQIYIEIDFYLWSN